MADQLDLSEHAQTLVVGAGPGGLLAALRAAVPGNSVTVLDEGDDITGRIEALRAGVDNKRTITSGFGGAGLFSDGKLCLSHRIGSTVAHRFPPHEVEKRQRAIDEVLRGDEDAPLHGADEDIVHRLTGRAHDLGMEYLHYPVRHIGSDQLLRMTSALRRRVSAVARVRCGVRCVDVVPVRGHQGRWAVDVEASGRRRRLFADHVVLAPGKVGAGWLRELGARLGLARSEASPKIGFRLEGPRGMLNPLLEVSTDPKVIWKPGAPGAEVRTHCVCFGGDVVPAAYRDLTLVGGHSTSEHQHDRTNTAVLATAGSGDPLSVARAREIVRQANGLAGGRVMAQRLQDFLSGVPSTGSIAEAASDFVPSIPDAVLGDLAAVFPQTAVALLRSYLRRLAKLCPQVLNGTNLLYGPAVERWADKFRVTDQMESPDHAGLYLVGDGPGLTGGIIGAAETGWLAGDAIATTRTAATASHS